MSDTLTAAAGASSAGRIRVGRTEYVVERPSGRKGSTALRLMRRASSSVKTITKELAAWEREYMEDNTDTLDRVQARMAYPGEPVILENTGELARDADGELILVSPLDAMTPEDWAKSGDRLRRPRRPGRAERIGAALDLALETAEDDAYRLLALFTLTNEEVARAKREQTLDDVLAERADVLLDEGGLDELLELAVVVAETVDEQFTRKTAALGGRLGKLRRLLGVQQAPEAPTPQEDETTPQTDPEAAQTDSATPPSTSSSRPTSSTDSDELSDGRPTSPSTATTPSSSPSGNGSTPSETEQRPAA